MVGKCFYGDVPSLSLPVDWIMPNEDAEPEIVWLHTGPDKGEGATLIPANPRKGKGEGPPNSQDPWPGCGCGYRQKATGARGRPLPSRVLAIPGARCNKCFT